LSIARFERLQERLQAKLATPFVSPSCLFVTLQIKRGTEDRLARIIGIGIGNSSAFCIGIGSGIGIDISLGLAIALLLILE
jgi:hypothetical protein